MEYKKFTVKGQGVGNYKATHYTSDSLIGWRTVYYQFAYYTDILDKSEVTIKDNEVIIVSKTPLGLQRTTIKVTQICKSTFKKAKKESEDKMRTKYGNDFKKRGLRWWDDFF